MPKLPQPQNINISNSVWEGRGAALNFFSTLGKEATMVFVDPHVRSSPYGKSVLEASPTDRELVLYSKISTNAPSEEAQHAATILRDLHPSRVIAMGGGSTIDLAKAAICIAYAGDSLDNAWNGKFSWEPTLPDLVGIPTTCGTGSEAVPFAVILDSSTRRKRGISHPRLIPTEIVLDPTFLDSLDSTIVAATALDAFAHALESYISSKATQLTRCSNVGTIMTIWNNIRRAVEDRDAQSLACLQVAATNARLLYPRTGLTIAHALSHPVGVYKGLHHGKAVALALGPTLRFNLESSLDRLSEVGEFLGLDSGPAERANALIERIEVLIDDLGVLKEYEYGKITDEEKMCIAEDAMLSSNISSNPRRVEIDDMLHIIDQF